MKKIIVRMRGGLGNQLFILASAYSVARQFEDYELVIDDREYKKYKIRSLEVTSLIRDRRVRMYDESKDKSLNYEITRELYHIYQGVFKKEGKSIKRWLSKRGYLYSYREGIFQFSHKASNNIYIYGYFQDEKNVCGIIGFMRSRINIPKPEMLRKEVRCIAVSVRCGDDYKSGGWPICSERYYKEAVDFIINKKYRSREVTVAVFSDDYKEAEKIKFGVRTVYMKEMSPICQLSELQMCRDFVISNSSFAWWGAYLWKDEGSIIVMPDKWYSHNEKTENSRLMIPGSHIMKID